MTTLAPYIYLWGLNNKAYKISSLQDMKRKLNANAVTLAFVVGNSSNEMSSDIYGWLEEIKSFQDNGGKVIISFGGAKGPYLEDFMNEDEEFEAIDKLLIDTGCKCIDYDVEGSYVSDSKKNDQRSKVLARLQNKYKDLYVSFTVAVDFSGIPQNGINMLKNAISNGVKIHICNLMLMDYFAALPNGKTWGLVNCDICEKVKKQLKLLYSSKPDSEIYKMIGVCPMIYKQDDNSIFTIDDAKTLASYANDNGLGLFSYWSINRDQVGTGDLSVFSQGNSVDFEFYNQVRQILDSPKASVLSSKVLAKASVLSSKVTVISEWTANTVFKARDIITYKGNAYECRIPHTSIVTWEPENAVALWTAVSTDQTWKSGKFYNIGDIVSYNNLTYKCQIQHTSIVTWEPFNAPALWLLSTPTAPVEPTSKLEPNITVTSNVKNGKICIDLDIDF